MSKDEVGPTSFASLRVAPDPPTTTQAVAYLTSDTDVQEVEDQIEEARKGGISGVPVVIIDGKWAISGGQTRDVYLQVNCPAFPTSDQPPLTHDLSSPRTTKGLQETRLLQRSQRQHAQPRMCRKGPLRKDRRVKQASANLPIVNYTVRGSFRAVS